MSGERLNWPVGVGIVEEDLQRGARAAAGGDDRAAEVFAAPGGVIAATYIRRVIPLHDEVRAHVDPRWNNPRMLCTDASYLGGTAGRVRVLPAAYLIAAPAAVASDGRTVELIATLKTSTDTPPIASSPAGRVDTVYATVTRSVPAGDGTRPRRMKDPVTGEVTTQNVAVYVAPAVTLGVATGTEGSATPGTVPADGAGTYNVPLCTVALTAGYVSGGVLADGGGDFVVQAWERGGVRPQAVVLARPAAFTAFVANADAGLGNLSVINSSRGSDRQIVRAVLRHTGAAAQVALDASMDWRNRFVRVAILRLVSQTPIAPFGNYPPPQLLATAGGTSVQMDTGWVWTGGLGDVATNGTAFWQDGGGGVRLFANATAGIDLGALVLEIDAAPTDGGHGGDHYIVIAEYLSADVE